MKIITNTFEAKGDNILNSDLNSEQIFVKNMEGKLENVNGDLLKKPYSEILKSETRNKVQNGIRNGFKEIKDKSVLQVHTNGYFDEISDDDFHLELDGSSDDENKPDANNIQENTSKTEFIQENTVDCEKNPSVPVDETQDILGAKDAEIISEELNTSEVTKNVTLVENSTSIVKLDSLLDCEKHEKEGSTSIEEKEEGITSAPDPCNSEKTNEDIGVNVVFSEVVIEDIEINSDKLIEPILEKTNDKLEKNDQCLNAVGSKTDNNEIVSANCVPETVLEKSLDEDFSINDTNDFKSTLSESENLLDSPKSLPSTKIDANVSLLSSDVFNSIKDSEIVIENKNLGDIFLNPNVLETASCELDSVSIETAVDNNSREKVECISAKLDNNLPLKSTGDKETSSNVKSCSGDDFSLNNVMESVVENFDVQKNSFNKDKDAFNSIGVSAPSVIESNSELSDKVISVQHSQENKECTSLSLESVNSSGCVGLSEINSFSSVDEKPVKLSVLNEVCELEETEKLKVDESNADLLQTVTDINERVENEETNLLEVSEPTSLEIESFNTMNDDDDSELFSVESTQYIPKENTVVLSGDENATDMNIENTVSENIEDNYLPTDEIESNIDNQAIVHSNDDEAINENFETDLSKEINTEELENEVKNVETEVVKDINNIDNISLKNEDNVHCMKDTTKIIKDELTDIDKEVTNLGVETNQDEVGDLTVKDEISESKAESINTDNIAVSNTTEEIDLKIGSENLNSVKNNESGNVGTEELAFDATLTNDKSFNSANDEKQDHMDVEDNTSDWLIEEGVSNVAESKELVEVTSDKISVQNNDSIELNEEFDQSNKEIQNKDTQSVTEEADEIKNTGVKRQREIEEGEPAAPLGERLNSTLDDDKRFDSKKLKTEDGDLVLNNTQIINNDDVKSNLTLKRSRLDTESTPNDVKKIKLSGDEEEKDLTVCSDVLEECLKFAETDNKVVDKHKEVVQNAYELENNIDVSVIRNILKSSIDAANISNCDTAKNSNKLRRNEANTLDKEKKKKATANKVKEESVKRNQKNISNLDLAIERVVEKSRINPENKIPCLKKFHKDQLKNLTRHDLEEVVIVKLCEAITDRSVIGELRQRCQKVEQSLDQWRKKAMQLEKSHREVEMVLKRYLQESSNTKKERQPLPIKVTRSVGLQVVLSHTMTNISRQKCNFQPTPLNRKQNNVPSKVVHPLVPTKSPVTPTVSGTNKSSRTPLSQAVPQQTQSGIKILPPKASQVDLQSSPPVLPQQRLATSTSTTSPRIRPSTSTPTLPINTVATPKASNVEVIDLTDKEEKNKQLQKQQQLMQQQKMKQQLIQQQQQQKQKQQILQQKQQQQKQLVQQQNQQAKQIMQMKSLKPSLQVQKPGQAMQSKQPSPQSIAPRVPTTVSQNGLRLVQTHQLTSNSPTQSMAILVPTSAGQNGTTRPPHLFIATPTPSQLRTSVPLIRPMPATTSHSTVMLRSQVLPIQQPSPVLRAPAATTTTTAFPRTSSQPVRAHPSVPVYKHPAALPPSPQHPVKPGVKLPPPKPQLKIAKTVNGIMLSWSMAIGKEVADIASYQLFAYQESSTQAPNTALWKKVGDVKALPLPMACTLTQFVEGHKYHFSVRAVDIHSRIGPFSVPGSILLTNTK